MNNNDQGSAELDTVKFTHRQQQAVLKAEVINEGQLLSEADEKTANTRRLMAAIDPISVSMPDDIGSLWSYAVHELNIATSSKAKAGLALLMLKERVGHGKFLPALEERDIPPRTAQEAMSIAHLLLKLPPSNARTLTHLGGSKLIELARLPEETLQEMANNDLFDGVPLDELGRMSVRELKEKLRKMKDRQQRELELKSKDIERKDQEIIDLKGQLADMEAQKLPPDDAEEAALLYIQDLHTQARSVVNVVSFEVMNGNLRKSSLPVKMACISFAEYLEKAGIALNARIRKANPETWDFDWPTDDEVDEADEAESVALEKLESQLPNTLLS